MLQKKYMTKGTIRQKCVHKLARFTHCCWPLSIINEGWHGAKS